VALPWRWSVFPNLVFFPTPPDFYEKLAGEFNLPYEGKALSSILSDNALRSDLVHPNAMGYARFAEALATLLKASGAY